MKGVSWMETPTDEVAILKVKPVQFIASGLCIHNIFVNDKGGTFSVVCDALTDLAVWESVSRFWKLVLGDGGRNKLTKRTVTYRMGPNFPKRSKSSSEETL